GHLLTHSSAERGSSTNKVVGGSFNIPVVLGADGMTMRSPAAVSELQVPRRHQENSVGSLWLTLAERTTG
ncbi:hypothetical protein KUCAC02_021515, partial [Chaenocephalus aceratus]